MELCDGNLKFIKLCIKLKQFPLFMMKSKILIEFIVLYAKTIVLQFFDSNYN